MSVAHEIVRASARLTTRCVNRCAFCAQDGLEAEDQIELEATLAELRNRADEITFTGGEPTLYPDLLGAITRARDLGFRAIGLQTNAAGLAEHGRIEALAQAGLTDVHLSVHGGSAEVHDYHSGRAGSFDETVAAAQRMKASALTVVATTVLTRSNFRVLDPIVALLEGLDLSAWALALPITAGRAADAFDRVVPRLGLALPFALHALTSARARGLGAVLTGAPLCGLGPHAHLALPSPARAFGEVCSRCDARGSCAGVDGWYLERYTAEELRPRDAVPASSPLPPRLARMFVGVGELVLREPTLHPAPARVRGSLPVLGKARPAQGEVRGRAAAQTGTELRDLFPTLFDTGEDEGAAGS